MEKGKERRYPELISISPDLKRAIATGITIPWMITPVLIFLTGCQEPEPREAELTPTHQLVPTYTPTPKIEVTPTSHPEVTPIPEIKIVLEPPVVPEAEPKEKEIFRNLSQKYPEVWEELSTRVEKVLAYQNELIEFTDFSAYQDLRIFEKYGKEKMDLPLNQENLFYILAWYELKYVQPIEQNPNFQRALTELKPVLKVVNEIIEDKVSPNEFVGGKVGQIPEDIRGRIIFSDRNGGGHFTTEIYVIEELFDPNPEKYQYLLEYFAGVVPHELIHAWPQALFAGQGSSWSHEIDYEVEKGNTLWDISQKYGLKVVDILEKNPQIENPDLIFPEQIIKIPQKGELIFPENRKSHLAHMSMCSLTAPAQERLSFEPGIEPRIVYIYSRLKEHGVEDPYGLIVQAGARMRGEDLWEVYKNIRGKDDLSLDELIATNDPDSDFSYYTSEELEAFRAEYAPYLSQK